MTFQRRERRGFAKLSFDPEYRKGSCLHFYMDGDLETSGA